MPSMRAKKLVIFDFDGTIADTGSIIMAIGNEVLHEYGFEAIPDSEYEQMRDMSIRDVMKRFPVPLHKMPVVLTSIQKSMKSRIDQLQPVQGIEKLLKELADDPAVNIALLTSNGTENVHFFLRKFSLLSCFTSVHSDVGIFSKNSQMKAIVKAENATQVLSVGDEVRDVEAAKKAKITTIAVDWGLNSSRKLKQAKPDAVVSTVSELRAELQARLDFQG